MLVAGVLAAYVFTEKNKLSPQSAKEFLIVKIVIILFVLVMFVIAVFSYEMQTALLGESFRKNGFITYLAFSVLFIASAKFIRFENIFIGLRFMLYAGAITGGYATIQILGLDWVNWSVQNQIISTFGNTNFSGVGMALFAIALLGNLTINLTNYRYAALNLVALLVLIYAIFQTNARQAILILVLGFAVYLSIYIFRYNKKIWLTFASAFALALVTVALAIFKIGPLQSFIYKDSLAVRQFYWLAGWEMFKQNPMAGVGIDHYGLYFKEYRQVGYPLSYGWDITSSNSHNVPIQMFATGGLFLGLLYLMIQLIVLARAIKLIKDSTGVKQSVSTLLFAIWLAYQAQSLFSIEMIGISIWGWVLGGSIVGLSMQDENQEVKKSRHSVELNTKRLVLVTAFMIALLTIIVPMRQAEKVTFQLQFDVGADKAQQIKNFNESFNELFNNNFVSTDYKNIGIYRALNLGENLKAIAELEKLIVKNARNLDTLGLLVEAYEKTGDFNSAIFYRNQISKYDPWNAKNYLGLAQLYKQVGNYSDMTRMVQKILSFAPNDPIALVAQKEFPPIAN
jgi:O-antigen ligase